MLKRIDFQALTSLQIEHVVNNSSRKKYSPFSLLVVQQDEDREHREVLHEQSDDSGGHGKADETQQSAGQPNQNVRKHQASESPASHEGAAVSGLHHTINSIGLVS